MDSQLVVIGGGPGGYAAAFMAADLGLKVTLLESDRRLGGVCLLRGCIPAKALLHATGQITKAQEILEWGIDFGQPGIDLPTLRSRTDKAVNNLALGLAQLARQRKVRVIRAMGRFEDSRTLRLEGGDRATYEDDRLRFEKCIIAAGSVPATLPSLKLDSPRMMDSTGGLELPEIPGRLLVIGGGYIGLEIGTMYANLGSRVTVVEMTDGLLPGIDRDLVRPLQVRLEQLYESIRLGTTVSAIREVDQALEAEFAGKGAGREQFEAVLVSVGRKPSSGGLGLENTKVRLDEKGFIKVGPNLATEDENIYAVGDIVGGMMLAHKALHEGRVAGQAVAGKDVVFAPRAIPAVVYTNPEIAYAGLTQEQAAAQGIDVQVVNYPWVVNGRAQGMGRTEGITKMILDPRNQTVLGVGITGSDAGELIAEAVLAIELGATAGDLALTIHPHPTMSETIAGAAEVFLGFATELYRPRRDGVNQRGSND